MPKDYTDFETHAARVRGEVCRIISALGAMLSAVETAAVMCRAPNGGEPLSALPLIDHNLDEAASLADQAAQVSADLAIEVDKLHRAIAEAYSPLRRAATEVDYVAPEAVTDEVSHTIVHPKKGGGS